MDYEIGDIVYWARILPKAQTFDVLDMKIVTNYDGYVACVEKKTKHRKLFYPSEENVTMFKRRNDALDVVHAAEKKFKNKKSNDNIEDLIANELENRQC